MSDINEQLEKLEATYNAALDKKDAEISSLLAENRVLKANLADVGNFHRHKFAEAVEKATDELFSTLSYHRMVAPRQDAS
jgi:hypothetical protein